MSIEAIRPIDSTPAVTPMAAGAAAPAGAPGFATALQRHLDQPRAEIAQVRAEVSAIRNGGALRYAPLGALPGAASEGARPPATPAEITSLLARQATGNAADPYGWRALSRQVGDSLIGPGYGAMFERQIQQESGFAPDVVMGLRRSSAGAEGIAQLMPQYYPHVNRTDPRASLEAGARSMQQYLEAWHGDVRKALASYNAGQARVQQAVTARGDAWESAIPQETRDYLQAIVGGVRPVFTPGAGFGGAASMSGASSAAGLPGFLGRSALLQTPLAGSLRALGGLGEAAP